MRRSPQFPLVLSRPVTKLLFYRKILRNPRSTGRTKLRRLVAATRDNLEAWAGINHQRPFVVTVSGIDGSGKSTVLRAIGRAFTLAEIRYRTVWVRGGNSVLLQMANRLFRMLMGRGLDRVLSEGEGEQRRTEKVIISPLLNVLWPWVVALEQAFLYSLRVRLPLAFGRVILMDRTLFDTLVELRIRCDDPGISRRLPLRLLARLAPRPGCAWHLRVDPAVAHARKADDFTPEALSGRAAHYDRMAKEWGFLDIRTDGDADETLRRVVGTTLERYFGAFPP